MPEKIKVLVSHPGKQYVHQLLYALQRQGYLQLFITSIWYKPSSRVYKWLLALPVIGTAVYHKFLRKKTWQNQQDNLVEQYPWKEFRRQCLVQLSTKYRTEKYVFEVEKAHDLYVAKRVKNLQPNVFIGYEKACLHSFEAVKKQGGITVLDLAQVHYQYLIELRNTQETFRDLFEDAQLFAEINTVKAAEYELADYILTLSQLAASTLVQHGIPQEKIKVVSLGYNPAVFYPKTYPALPAKKETFRLVYTGTFTIRKGVHLLLEAIRQLQLPNLELIIIGPVLDGAELLQQYAGLFRHYDFLHHEELVQHLHQSDVYVFPSYLDSWAMTVIEAMACALPVIVTENTGAKDAVVDGESGYVIPINDLEVLKEKILHFYQHPEECKRVGENAATAAKAYQWEQYYSTIAQFIDTISA